MSCCMDGGPVMFGVDDRGAVLKSSRGEGSLEEYLLKRRATTFKLFRARVFSGYGVFLAKVKATGHPGFSDYYLFECRECKQLRVSYAHGHSGYLTCQPCEERSFSKKSAPHAGYID